MDRIEFFSKKSNKWDHQQDVSKGELIGLSSDGQEYFYIRDLTGNINKIVDEKGDIMVKYTYDT